MRRDGEQFGEADEGLLVIYKETAECAFAKGDTAAGTSSFQKALAIAKEIYGLHAIELADLHAATFTCYSAASMEREAENAVQDVRSCFTVH